MASEYLIEILKSNLGLDSESAEQIADHAKTLSDPDARIFLLEMLGDSSKIQQYFRLKVTSRTKGEMNLVSYREQSPHHIEGLKANSTTKVTPTGSNQTSPKSSRPSTPVGPGSNNEKQFKYHRGVWEHDTGKKKQQNPAKPSSKSSSKIKVDSLADIDAALKQLDITNGKREPCNCMATRHPLLEIAPNCLNCGKIICAKEGLGPCTFCGKQLLSNEELAQINQVLIQEKEEITASMGKKARKQAGIDSGITVSSLGQTANALGNAQQRLDTLLQYQASGAERTKIIDQVSDFELPSYGVNKWASPMEQAQQLKRQQRQLRKLQEQQLARAGRGKKVISIDLKGNKVYMEEKDAPLEEAASEDESEIIEVPTELSKRPSTYWNPATYGKNFVKPTYAIVNRETPKPHNLSAELNDNVNRVQTVDDETRALEL
jgi:hypothetical protein